MIKLTALIMAGAGLVWVSMPHAETLLMSQQEYIERCMDTYGEDRVTRKVCESQYQAMEKKEQELMAQASASQDPAWSAESPQAEEPDSIER